jgi:hypothetical protein
MERLHSIIPEARTLLIRSRLMLAESKSLPQPTVNPDESVAKLLDGKISCKTDRWCLEVGYLTSHDRSYSWTPDHWQARQRNLYTREESQQALGDTYQSRCHMTTQEEVQLLYSGAAVSSASIPNPLKVHLSIFRVTYSRMIDASKLCLLMKKSHKFFRSSCESRSHET